MKRFVLAGLIAIICIAQASAADTVRIKATKKTADKRKSEQQRLPRGATTQTTTKDIYYEFEITSVNAVDEEIVVEYLLALETAKGQVLDGPRERLTGKLPRAGSVKVETKTLELRGRKIGGSTIEDKLYGYGVRVKNMKGEVLGEKMYPSKMKEYLDGEVEEKSPDEPRNPGMTSLPLRRQQPVRR